MQHRGFVEALLVRDAVDKQVAVAGARVLVPVTRVFLLPRRVQDVQQAGLVRKHSLE